MVFIDIFLLKSVSYLEKFRRLSIYIRKNIEPIEVYVNMEIKWKVSLFLVMGCTEWYGRTFEFFFQRKNMLQTYRH